MIYTPIKNNRTRIKLTPFSFVVLSNIAQSCVVHITRPHQFVSLVTSLQALRCSAVHSKLDLASHLYSIPRPTPVCVHIVTTLTVEGKAKLLEVGTLHEGEGCKGILKSSCPAGL